MLIYDDPAIHRPIVFLQGAHSTRPIFVMVVLLLADRFSLSLLGSFPFKPSFRFRYSYGLALDG